MIPYICDGNLIDKTLQPKIAINDCLSCEVNEELNGEYECTLTLPAQSQYTDFVQVGKYIFVKPNPLRNPQYFKIYKTNIALNGNFLAYAEHIRYVLNYYPCPMVYGDNISMLINNINSSISYTTLPFTLFTDKTTTTPMRIDSIKSIGAVMAGSENSLIDVYGGEWEFDNYTCMLWANRGSNKNIVLQYGYDINSCNREIEHIQAYTHVFPYYEWVLEDGSISTITLSHKSLESKYPAILARDLIQIDSNYVAGDVMRIYMLNLAEVVQIDLTVGYYNYLNIESMASYWLEDNKANLLGLSVSTTLDFAYIKQNIALNQCVLADTIRLRVPQLNVETTAKISKTKYDAIKECYTSIDVGTLKRSIDVLIADNTNNIQINRQKIARTATQMAN